MGNGLGLLWLRVSCYTCWAVVTDAELCFGGVGGAEQVEFSGVFSEGCTVWFRVVDRGDAVTSEIERLDVVGLAVLVNIDSRSFFTALIGVGSDAFERTGLVWSNNAHKLWFVVDTAVAASTNVDVRNSVCPSTDELRVGNRSSVGNTGGAVWQALADSDDCPAVIVWVAVTCYAGGVGCVDVTLNIDVVCFFRGTVVGASGVAWAGLV